MASIDQGRIAGYLKRGDEASTSYAKGKAFEDLIAFLFAQIPGLEESARNQLNAFGAQEVDVAFWNDQLRDGLRQFDHLLIIECKNWDNPVGDGELSMFREKLRSRGRPLGIMVAACGITGTPELQNRAHQQLATCLAEGREILVVTRKEIEALSDSDQLVRLLKQKRLQLAVSGTIFEAERV
jgi:hypothetical protein